MRATIKSLEPCLGKRSQLIPLPTLILKPLQSLGANCPEEDLMAFES